MSIALFLFSMSLLAFRFAHELLTYLPNRNFHMDRVISKVLVLVVYSNILFALIFALNAGANNYQLQDLMYMGFLSSIFPMILFYFFYSLLTPMVNYYGK